MSVEGQLDTLIVGQAIGIAVNAQGFNKVTQALAEQHATLSAMADAQARAEAQRQYVAQREQLAFETDGNLKLLEGLPPNQWREESWDYFVALPNCLQQARLNAADFSDLRYKQLCLDICTRYATLTNAAEANAPAELAKAKVRVEAQLRAAAEAAAEEERRNRAAEKARQAQLRLEASIGSGVRTALIVTLVGFFCFPLAVPAGFFLAWQIRGRAKREAPHLVSSTNLAFFLSGGYLLLIAVVLLFMGLAGLSHRH